MFHRAPAEKSVSMDQLVGLPRATAWMPVVHPRRPKMQAYAGLGIFVHIPEASLQGSRLSYIRPGRQGTSCLFTHPYPILFLAPTTSKYLSRPLYCVNNDRDKFPKS
jgi:hypothetical protein